MRSGTALLLPVLLASCAQPPATSPQEAEGDTPIRYVICGTSCFVAARFNSMDGCESHKKWADMLCVSEPNGMSCKNDDRPISSAYCTM